MKSKQYHLQGKPYRAWIPSFMQFLEAVHIHDALLDRIVRIERTLAETGSLLEGIEIHPFVFADFAKLHIKHNPSCSVIDIAKDTIQERQLPPTRSLDAWMKENKAWSKEYLIELARYASGDHTMHSFRNTQLWIQGPSAHEAMYVPPHKQDIPMVMEEYVHGIQRDMPISLKVSISLAFLFLTLPFSTQNAQSIFYQLPFLEKEGNMPVLGVGESLLAHMSTATELLLRVFELGDLGSWCDFTLDHIEGASQKTKEKVRSYKKISAQIEHYIEENTRSHSHLSDVFGIVKDRMFITSRELEETLGLSKPNIHRLIKQGEESGFLQNLEEQKRNRIFFIRPLHDILWS